MKKWVLRIGFFLLSLFLGLGTGFVMVSPAPISLCEIDANPDKYAGKIVRLRVLVFNSVSVGAPITLDRRISACSLCAGSGGRPWANVGLDADQISLLPETRDVWEGDHASEEGKRYATDTILIGHFETPVGITGCFGPKYDLSEARIERVLATHEFDSSEQFLEWLKSNSQ
jgi:hypothetical protein